MAKDIEAITKELEQGVKDVFASPEYTEYLQFMGKFYNYSANNCLLIWMQNPAATLVAGYKAWQTKFKRQVRKGEKGITILAPVPHKIKKAVLEDGDLVEKEIQWTSFRAVSVFDISQTDGDAVPSFEVNELTGDVEGYDELVKKLEELAPCRVDFEVITGGAKGFYSLTDKRIAINEGMAESQTIKTMVHEIAHAILHDKDGEQKDADRRTAEVQAESVAYTVCSAMGLDTSDYSFGYVAEWSAGKEVKELTASMDVIRKTAGEILEALRAA